MLIWEAYSHVANLQMPAAHMDQLAANLQKHAAAKASSYNNRGIEAPRVYRTE